MNICHSDYGLFFKLNTRSDLQAHVAHDRVAIMRVCTRGAYRR